MLCRIAFRQTGAFGQILNRTSGVSSTLSIRGFKTEDRPNESEIERTVRHFDEANSLFYGPERDLKNFPIVKQRLQPPPVKIGFIPQAWFDAFYEKTGVTGPYLLGIGFLTTLLSKELWVVEHGFGEFLSFSLLLIYVNKKYGSKISDFFAAQTPDLVKEAEDIKKEDADLCNIEIEDLKESISHYDAARYIFETKKENVALQLEAEYRKRLSEVHTAVKKRLDYQVEVEATKKRYEHQHMVDWIVKNVVKGITPQQEKESVSQCITDLKKLAV